MAEVSVLPDGVRGLHVSLEEVEVALLQSLARQLEDLVGPRDDPDADPLVALVGIDPAGPDTRRPGPAPAAAGRLPRRRRRPPGSSGGSPSATCRRVEGGQRRAGRCAARGARAERSTIAGDAIPAWLGFLNDTRLTIGTRLEISEENHDALADLPDSDPRAGLFQVYDWLTFLQESIVQRLLPSA